MEHPSTPFQLSLKTPELTALVCKALSSEVRLKILYLLKDFPKNISDLASLLNIPLSTMTTHIRILEQAKLISVTSLPGARGTQKRCALVVSSISLEFSSLPEIPLPNTTLLAKEEMPIGNYFDYNVTAPCGIISHEKQLFPYDDPGRFSSPQRMDAQLIWLTTGYLEYRFPLDAAFPFQMDIERIEFSFEICSETYNYNEFWKSDVTIWINNHEIGYIECPGDHGGRHGLYSPSWWNNISTQYGDLCNVILTKNGCTLNSYTTDAYTLDTLDVCSQNYISFKLGVKSNARYVGGMNLFGEKFGDYPQAICMRIYGNTKISK